ncbi:TolC family protein [Bradymonadaceae bacterium TMQ3]|nr:TolC family protein [Bradymonadaceae bacterium TMQ3]TXC78232.1 TolC family protein [Bradymonadales bacterium TMQ1]
MWIEPLFEGLRGRIMPTHSPRVIRAVSTWVVALGATGLFVSTSSAQERSESNPSPEHVSHSGEHHRRVEATPPSDESIAALDAQALENHPGLRTYASRAEEAALAAEVEQGRWPEPRVEYMAEFSTPWAAHQTTDHMVTLMQTIPWPATRRASAAPARAMEQAARAEERAAAHQILRDIRRELVAIARAREMLLHVDEEVGLVADVRRIIEATLPVGRAEHSDLYRLQLAEAGLEDMRRDEEARLRAAKGRLANLLGVSTDALNLPETTAILDWTVDLPSREELAAMIEANSPVLARFEAERAQARAQEELVERQLRPPPQIMVGYGNMAPMYSHADPRHDVFQVGFSIALPIWGGRYGTEARRWQAGASAAEEARAAALRDLLAQLESARSRATQADERVEAYREELMPMASLVSAEVLTGVEVGQRSVTDYLGAVREEWDLHGRYLELKAERANQLLELQYLSAGQLAAESPWAYPASLRGQ